MLCHTFLKNCLNKFSTVYPSHPDLSSTQSTFHSSKLRSIYRKDLLDLPKFDPVSLPFGKAHSDHIISVDYDRHQGWSSPILQPFQNLKLHPFSSGLHYAVQCYEGTKAYKNEKGEIRLFRVDANTLRFKRTSVRLTLPDFDGQELINLITTLVKTQERWIPPITQYSLYVRPLHLGVSQTLGVHTPEKSKILIMTGPVGPYYSTGFKPISLYCVTDAIRSAPKGTGGFKIGGNYGPTIQVADKVISRGHQQALWLYEDKVIEVGSSNIFFIFKDSKSGQIEIATPDLQDLILPGVTRDSILEMLRHQKQYKVSERQISILEVVERHKRGQLLECFGAGTAVIVSGVNNIEYNGVNYPIPVDASHSIGLKIRQKLLDIQEGRVADKYGWVTRIK